MKQLLASGIAAMLFACSGSARADADYKASLAFDLGLPALRTGGVLDGPHNLDGDWTTLGIRTANAKSRDQLGSAADGSAIWGDLRWSPGLHNFQGVPTTLGEIIAHNSQLGYVGSGTASISFTSITSTGRQSGGWAELDVAADWKRGFSLAAGESMTFSSLCSLDILGGVAALNSTSWFNLDAASSFAKLTMADTANRVGANLSASLTSLFAGDLADVFGYTTGPDGRLTLSITNTTDQLMTGWLGAGTYVNVSGPIPEPATVAMAALGLGLVGGMAQRAKGRAAAVRA